MIDVFELRDEESTKAEIPSPDDTTVEVISQFGTARESTLAMLQGYAARGWDDPSPGPAHHPRRGRRTCSPDDADHLEKIVRLLGSPSAYWCSGDTARRTIPENATLPVEPLQSA